MEPTPIAFVEIRDLCDRVLTALARAVDDDDVALHVDYYWSIPRTELYNVYQQPSELTVGQISEELEKLRHLLENDDDAVVPQALRWLGAVLTAVGDEMTP